MVDVAVVDAEDLVPRDLDGRPFHYGVAKVLNHSPVGIIFAMQRDRERQPRGPGDNHIVCAKVGKPDQQLLVLVDCARVVGNDDASALALYAQGLTEAPIRIKLASELI